MKPQAKPKKKAAPPTKPAAKPAKQAKPAAKAPDFRICPACETRNKAKWDICVRCGESLEKVPLGLPPGMASAAPEAKGGGSLGAGAILTGLVAVVALGGAVYFAVRPAAAPAPPSSDIWVMPTQPGTLPPATPIPTDEAAQLFARGMTALGAKRFPEAVDLISSAVGKAPDRAEYHAALARALWGADQKDRAIAEYQEAASRNPTTANFSDLASALAVTGAVDPAVVAFRQAIAADPGNTRALDGLAALLIKENRAEEALVPLRAMVQQTPGDPAGVQRLAFALEKAGHTDEAITEYQRILVGTPQAVLTRGLLAEALFKAGRGPEGVQVFRDGLVATPDAPLLHRGLGSLLERMGNKAEAAVEYREYVKLAPNAQDAKDITVRAEKLAGGGTPPAPPEAGSAS